jgi:hypothetical protein
MRVTTRMRERFDHVRPNSLSICAIWSRQTAQPWIEIDQSRKLAGRNSLIAA